MRDDAFPREPRKLEPVIRSEYLPESYQELAQRLRDPSAFVSPQWRRVEYREGDGGDPIYEFVTSMRDEFRRRQIPMFAVTVYRGKEAQDSAFARGTSKARFGQSAHNFKMAVDFVHIHRMWNLSRKEWEIIGLIGKEVARRRNIRITWGGDFKSLWDPAHWELADWKQRRDALPK